MALHSVGLNLCAEPGRHFRGCYAVRCVKSALESQEDAGPSADWCIQARGWQQVIVVLARSLLVDFVGDWLYGGLRLGFGWVYWCLSVGINDLGCLGRRLIGDL
ncbi:hypothetical protein KM043_001239 [Ampulex compressa]|nr:hypothetical protein KM043_001239 [Ampulex compressa]